MAIPRQSVPSVLRSAILVLVAVVATACGSSSAAENTATSVAPSPTVEVVATPTATPSPNSTANTPTATPPIGDGRNTPTVEDLTARALEHLRELAEGLPPRVSGTDGELAAAGYVADQLRSYGYDVQLQEFTARSRPRNGNHLQITSPVPRPVRTNIFSGSGEGDITGPLVSVGLARESDLPNFPLTGTVALVERGVIPFAEKARNVFEAGAEGMVVFNSSSEIFDGTLGDGFAEIFDRPSVTISGVNGQALIEELEDGPVNVNLRLVTDVLPSRNVVATKPGPTTDGPVVIIGGHMDAVPGTPGANDNASGTATILVLAEELAKADIPFELRVIGFGSEELGLLGSVAYVASLTEVDKSRISAMFNYDALGSGSLEIGGHFELSDRGLEVAEEIGISAVHGIEPVNATSDHASFREAGIRSMFFFGSDFSLIHTPFDTIEAMDPEMMGKAASITLSGLLDELGVK
ncbi:MAG: M28 family peptidase [Chloroflexi bacterium]|nr:M28 family peptidase [Chloroflexota bacterium]MBT6682538.1 M28 family peptidase [Chloroflexota bacterium]